MDSLAVFTIAVLFFLYGITSRKLQRTIVTGPIFFTVLGFIAGPAALQIIPLKISNTVLHYLAEITLVLVLFTDAANIDLKQVRQDHNLPVRMLVLGMPLTIVLGTLCGFLLLPHVSLWEAALLAAILTPTDAALGQAVFNNHKVPVRIRQALNIESGLNDGIALPFVLIFAALAGSAFEAGKTVYWLVFIVKQLLLGPIVGMLVCYVGAKLVAFTHREGWMDENSEGIVALALAFSSFALAEFLHGNGFIAAFIGGLTFGNTMGRTCKFIYKFTESEGQILTLFTFTAFGSAMLPIALANISLSLVLYALLMLTVFRLVPVCLSLLGSGIRPVTHFFLSWFGPRGLASILFVLLILEKVDLSGKETVFYASIITVTMSIFLHGITAGPFSKLYAARVEKIDCNVEKKPVAHEPFMQMDEHHAE